MTAVVEDKTAFLEEQAKKKDALLVELNQRQIVLHSLLTTLTGSRKWRLTAPLRALRQLVRPKRLEAAALIPVKQLVPTANAEPGTWTSCGNDPQFLAPCLFPKGWLRVRLQIRSSVQGRLEIHADSGLGFHEEGCLERIEIRRSVQRDFYVYLDRPACTLRLDPLDVEGEFRLKQFSVEHVPGQGVLRRLGT